jgi:hypothetical protein
MPISIQASLGRVSPEIVRAVVEDNEQHRADWTKFGRNQLLRNNYFSESDQAMASRCVLFLVLIQEMMC